jgi:hypothetical protein
MSTANWLGRMGRVGAQTLRDTGDVSIYNVGEGGKPFPAK